MYIKLNNGSPEPYSIPQFRADNPHTSFPAVLSDELLAQHGVHKITVLSPPKHDSRTHVLQQSALYEVNGAWQTHYSAEPLPLAVATKNVKEARDRLLAETDWVVTKAYETKTEVPQAWAAYRQQLRDLPMQPNFPHGTVWPTKP
jgi:hypothetical protein